MVNKKEVLDAIDVIKDFAEGKCDESKETEDIICPFPISYLYNEDRLGIVFNNGKQMLYYDNDSDAFFTRSPEYGAPIECKLIEVSWNEKEIGEIYFYSDNLELEEALKKLNRYFIYLGSDEYGCEFCYVDSDRGVRKSHFPEFNDFYKVDAVDDNVEEYK
ncbi:MAG: hypothetical protein ACOC5T_00495 [Elusimicrobiota bacterium]